MRFVHSIGATAQRSDNTGVGIKKPASGMTFFLHGALSPPLPARQPTTHASTTAQPMGVPGTGVPLTSSSLTKPSMPAWATASMMAASEEACWKGSRLLRTVPLKMTGSYGWQRHQQQRQKIPQDLSIPQNLNLEIPPQVCILGCFEAISQVAPQPQRLPGCDTCPCGRRER